MKIIDTHVHIGGDILGFDMKEETVITMMKKYSIDYSLVSNCDSGEVDDKQKLIPVELQTSQIDSLARTLRFAKQYPDKIGVGVWVKPLQEELTKEFEQMIRDNLQYIKAIKLHPYHSKTSPIDSKTIPYLKLASELNLPVVVHTAGSEESRPLHVYEAAKMFPNIPFVMVHMGLGTDNKEALDLLGKLDNLYGDTTWVPMSTTIEAIHRYGSSKMLFGSDAPIDGLDTYLCNPNGDRSVYQDYFHVLPNQITAAEYEDLMYKNAEKIFHLNV